MIIECAVDSCIETFEEFGTGGRGRRKKHCDAHSGKSGKHVERERKRLEHKLTFYAVDGEGENRAWRVAADTGGPNIFFPFPGEDLVGERLPWSQWEKVDDDYAWEEHGVIKDQDYVMLSVGDHTLSNKGHILTYEQIFPFLYDRFLDVPEEERKYAVFVGFRLQYDFTMFIRHIHEKTATRLFSKEGIENRRVQLDSGASIQWPVYVWCDHSAANRAEWEIDFLGMKRFKIRPHVPKKDWPPCEVNHKTKETIEAHAAGECRVSHPYQWMFICDSSSYFQGAFLAVIDPKDWGDYPIVSQEEYDILLAGKSNRNAARFGTEMERYNLMENEVLARVMERMNEGFVQMGIRIPKDKWYGPGAAAQLWLKNHGMPTAKTVEEHVPSWALDAGQYAYYGGRFENAMHGPVPGKMYNYDINSAYPYAIATMPCLLHGKWTRGTGKPPELGERTLRLGRIKAIGNNKWLSPLPYRNSKGGVLFPQQVIGWYWQFEIDAAKKAKLLRKYDYLDWVDYEPCGCAPPVASVQDAYQERLTVGKNTPHGKALKLIVNSLYGKYAQSIGMPTYACSLYASYITASCRTQILEAIATHPVGPKAVSKIATDGVYFTSPHPDLPISKELGDWDETVYENMSFFLPGVDWDDKTREKLEATGKATGNVIRSRGVSAQKLAENINNIDPQWEALKQWLREQPRGKMFPVEDIPILPTYKVNLGWGYVSPKLAVARGKWDQCGVSKFTEERVLNSDMLTKRSLIYLDWDKNIIRSTPHPWGSSESWIAALDEELESHYYDKTFGRVEDNENDVFYELNNFYQPDGTLGQYLGSMGEG